MKKVKNLLTVLLVLFFVFTVMSGCGLNSQGTDKQRSVALSIVYGVHRYNPVITSNSEQLKNEIQAVAETNGHVIVTICDGKPSLFENYNLAIPDKGQSEAKVQQIISANIQLVLTDISTGAVAKTEEVDTLSAIEQARNNVVSCSEDIKRIIIFDNGLSTTGYLNMSKENLLDSDPGYIVKELKEKYAIPDLSDIDEIVWYGLGQVRGEQPVLTSYHKHRLKGMWEEILKAGNAKNIEFKDNELSNDYSDKDLPAVSIVPVVSESIKGQNVDTETFDKNEIIKLDETTLSFKGDSDEFLNNSKANDVINTLSKKLSNTNSPVYIIGSTASVGSKQSNLKLSQKRAERVKKELLKKGIRSAMLITKGIGSSSCLLRTNDLDSKGALIENQAKKNRAVFVMSADNSVISEIEKLT